MQVPPGPLTAEALARTVAHLHQEHQRLYTYASPELPVELVNVRVSARGPAWPFVLPPLAAGRDTAAPQPGTRQVYFGAAAGFVDCPVYIAAELSPGWQLTGPAIIHQALSTVVVEPQHCVRMDAYGNLIMQLPAAGAA